ncbi:BT4734/BF3469 family protein [Xylanibacter ruminicola]|uniref:BT4734/BF3469 family protein n=1 Tax=Xylanibacter ruminicola TaxID=839 RepID=UPI000490A73A|nr:BT4734/BF3469 family protein [Xylanibacter ruminicola]
MGFCYQENTHFSQAVKCSREKFWDSVRDASTVWKIDSRREILEAVEQHNSEVINKWLKNEDYGKFLAKKRGLKKQSARQKFFDKTDEERLLAFAQELKDNLTAFIFSCYEFDATPTANGNPFCHRRLADCHLNGLVMLDIDHVDNPLEIFEALNANQELMARTALAHITSSKKGIRIIFTADIKEGNLADNQIVFAEKLGYKADSSCIDATRNSFAPKEEDILYINEDLLFDYYDEDFDREYTPKYRERQTQPLFHKFPTGDGADSGIDTKTDAVACEGSEQGTETVRTVDAETLDLTWKGYDVQCIIDLRYGDKLPCAADSNRHNESLKLASDLLIMYDGDKQKTLQMLKAQKWVQEIIDERDENVEQTVSSAAQRMAEREKKYLSQQPSKAMQDAIKEATGQTYQEITQAKTSTSAAVTEVDIERWLWDWGNQIEALMPDFPLLQDICKGLKKNQYPAAVFVAGGLMMTLMTRCTYRFYHRPEELRRLNNSTLIIGDPASGKSFATRLFKLLAAPMVAADKAGIAAINRYKEEMKTKGANKEKPQKPKALFRVHPARTSNAQFIQDMVNAVEVVDGEEMQLHMLTFDTELDNTLTVQKGGSWIDKMSLELKAFHNEEDGQAYSNLDSVVQNFFVFWNYIYTGTPMALKKKVNAQNFGSGLATRLTCIPLPSTNFEMMTRESHVDFESDGRLKEWAFKLDRMKGELSVQKIVDELYDWTARRMADAAENNSKADEMLLKRCAYHGLNFSAPFIVMRHWADIHQDGQYWCGQFETDATDWKLAELIVTIQYACQRHYFGALAEKYFDDKTRDAAANTPRRAKTIEAFNRLPEEFTIDDVIQCFALKNNTSARTRVVRMMKDNLVVKVDEFVDNGTTKAMYKKTGMAML